MQYSEHGVFCRRRNNGNYPELIHSHLPNPGKTGSLKVRKCKNFPTHEQAPRKLNLSLLCSSSKSPWANSTANWAIAYLSFYLLKYAVKQSVNVAIGEWQCCLYTCVAASERGVSLDWNSMPKQSNKSWSYRNEKHCLVKYVMLLLLPTWQCQKMEAASVLRKGRMHVHILIQFVSICLILHSCVDRADAKNRNMIEKFFLLPWLLKIWPGALTVIGT